MGSRLGCPPTRAIYEGQFLKQFVYNARGSRGRRARSTSISPASNQGGLLHAAFTPFAVFKRPSVQQQARRVVIENNEIINESAGKQHGSEEDSIPSCGQIAWSVRGEALYFIIRGAMKHLECDVQNALSYLWNDQT